MKRIIINEVDETFGSQTSLDNIVFIPGFSTADLETTPENGQTTFAPAKTPTLCRTVREFTDKFGSTVPPCGTDYDTGYLMAAELLFNGIPVIYYRVNEGITSEDFTVAAMEAELSDIYSPTNSVLLDYDYDIKYITSGGYYTFNNNDLDTQMLALCAARGDCIALIDHSYNSGTLFSKSDADTRYASNLNLRFGTMFTPWASYSMSQNYTFDSGVSSAPSVLDLPASFAYLLSLALSVKTYPNWLAIAGVSRGLIPNIQKLNTASKLTNAVADAYQVDLNSGEDTGVSINAITYIRPYGYCIWGNRTLFYKSADERKLASNYLNIRCGVAEIKKTAYAAAQSLMFEQNTDVLWVNFKSKVAPLLDQMTSTGLISNYKVIRESVENTDKVKARIQIYPVYAVEVFEIDVILSNSEVTTSE